MQIHVHFHMQMETVVYTHAHGIHAYAHATPCVDVGANVNACAHQRVYTNKCSFKTHVARSLECSHKMAVQQNPSLIVRRQRRRERERASQAEQRLCPGLTSDARSQCPGLVLLASSRRDGLPKNMVCVFIMTGPTWSKVHIHS